MKLLSSFTPYAVPNLYNFLLWNCNEVSRYGKKEAGTGEHSRHFNNKINKHKWKAAAPHGWLPHTKHKLKSRPGPLSSSTVVTPHLTLPKLLRGTRDRWVAQVSFITNYSTGLAPFPQLSAPPHSSQEYKTNNVSNICPYKERNLCWKQNYSPFTIIVWTNNTETYPHFINIF